MNNTVPPPPATIAETQSSLHTSLLKSLQLTVTPSDPAPVLPGDRVPDSGVEVPSTIEDFSEGSGSLADRMRKIEREVVTTSETPPPTEPTTPPAVPPTAETPPTVVVPPPPAAETPPAPTTPELPKFKIPELPKPILEDPAPLPPQRLDMTGLDEDEQEEVRTALFAEQQYPDRYKGYGTRVLDYIRKHKHFVQQQEQEDPNVSFDHSNQSYQKFLEANRPPVTNSERKRLERERLLEEAATLAEKKLSSKTKRLEEELVQLKATPLVEKTLNDYKSLVKDLMPKEDDPIVVEAVVSMTGKAVEAANEFLLLSSNLKPYDAKSDTHKWLADFIQEQGDLYVKSGHESLRRGTRSFVPRAKFNSLPPEQREKHFTFTDEDILQLIAVNATHAATYHSTNEKKRLEKAGYIRSAPTPASPPPAPAPVVPPSPAASPRASSSIAPPTSPDSTRPADPFLRFMGGR